MTSVFDQLKPLLRGRYPLILIHTSEEGRVERTLRERGKTDSRLAVRAVWSCTQGLQGSVAGGEVTRHPVAAIRQILGEPQPGLYLFKDIDPFFDQPDVVRTLRDAYSQLDSAPGTHLLLISTRGQVPESLLREVIRFSLPLPDAKELEVTVASAVKQFPEFMELESLNEELTHVLSGLSEEQAKHMLFRVLSGGLRSQREVVEEVVAAKQALVGDAGYLQYVRADKGIDDVAGLKYLRSWIDARSQAFSQRAVEAGSPVPKGVLFMGISGCGKSLCAKVIANRWRVPLFRLDMNQIYARSEGSPEACFSNALRAVEQAAPAVLWIDEIENALGFAEDAAPADSHMFSAFLTWMQEKPPLVFVAATANRIEHLPAEMIRKGRFDQVFFCDLPDEEERAELFDLHIAANGGTQQPEASASLVLATKGWTGAEIEEVVVAAKIEAGREQRDFTAQDILAQARDVVPLSQTMSRQIRKIRDWAFQRAIPASRGGVTELKL